MFRNKYRISHALCILENFTLSRCNGGVWLTNIIALMMEAARTSETSVENYFTRRYIPEDKSEHHQYTLHTSRKTAHRHLIGKASFSKLHKDL
jgi:hypothetical protein